MARLVRTCGGCGVHHADSRPAESRVADVRVPGIDAALTFAVHATNDKHVSEHIATRGVWEPLETEVIGRFLGPDALFVDCGANLGWFSVIAAARGAHVVAFEPFPPNAALLRDNISRNSFSSKIEMHQRALGSAPGVARLDLSEDNQGDHRVAVGPTRRRSVDVEVVTLDATLAGRNPSVMKLDTQGSEVAILRGATIALAANPMIVLEFWPYGLSRCGANAEELLAIVGPLVDTTHACFEIVEFRGGLVPLSLDDIVAMTQHGGYTEASRGFTNLAFVPLALVDRVRDLVIAPLSFA
jgi:FkbM family methyltransferase